MKRYISAILIPCLLLQFFGCSSVEKITVEELKHFEGDDNIILTTKNGEIIINRYETEYKSMNWEARDSFLYVESKEWVPEDHSLNLRKIETNKEITYNDIDLIQVESADILGTIGVTLGIILGVQLVAIAVWLLTGEF